MSVLTPTQRATLVRLIDGLYPSVDGIIGAVQAGVPEALERNLGNPPWNGQRRYTAGPHATPDHPGHGWQGAGSPAESLAAALDEIAAWDGETDVLTALSRGDLTLHAGIHGVDLFRILHRYTFEHLHGEAAYGWLQTASGVRG